MTADDRFAGPIGVFDSGIGGLSVLSQIRRLLPEADLLYVADRARAPYGTRRIEEVREISHQIAEWLLDRGARCLVVACNTASAAALASLRAEHPGLAVVGMEPALKPAALRTETGTVAVFATAATFQGELFASLLDRFASDVDVISRACPEWVEAVEHGTVSGAVATEIVSAATAGPVAAGADQIVLGCTHFSFLSEVITSVTGIEPIDPAPAVAAQVSRVASQDGGQGSTTLAASGDLTRFEELATAIAGIRGNVIPFAP